MDFSECLAGVSNSIISPNSKYLALTNGTKVLVQN